MAFAIPIGFIVIVALSTYLPSLAIKTDYNFVYSLCTDGSSYYSYDYCDKQLMQRYGVADGKMVVNDLPLGDNTANIQIERKYDFSTRIFLHNTGSNVSKEITESEAMEYTLSSLLTSPDGITVSSHYDRGSDLFIIFDGGSSYGYYLTEGRNKKKLNLINDDSRYYYRDNFHFIGWILN